MINIRLVASCWFLFLHPILLSLQETFLQHSKLQVSRWSKIFWIC